METLFRDTRYALRGLLKAPGFTLVVIVTLALGIGANTAVFSVVNSVLLRPLPYKDPEGLMAITYNARDPKQPRVDVPSPSLFAWVHDSRTFEEFTSYFTGQLTLLARSGEQLRVTSASIPSNFLSLLGVPHPVLGRDFSVSDDLAGAPHVVMLSDSFWRQRFGANKGILGERLRLNGSDYTVIGVAPEAFRFPDYATPDIFVPLALSEDTAVVRFVNVIGRLRPGSSLDRAEAELTDIGRRAAPSYPAAMEPLIGAGAGPEVAPLQRRIAGDLHGVLLIALGAVGCVLLLACANVVSLLLARSTSRERELGVRAALGATRAQLCRHILAETLVLAVLSGVAALLALSWLIGGLRALLAATTPHPQSIRIDGWVLGFTAVVTMSAAFLCAGIPIARMLRRELPLGVKLSAAGAARSTMRDPMRKTLVVGQVAVALILLISGLLLINSLWRLTGAGLGFEPERVLTVKISAMGLGISDARRASAVGEILDRIRVIPGVVSAGSTTSLPLAGHAFGFTVPVEGGAPPPLSAQNATAVDFASPGYFRTMGVNMIAGREFDDRDGSPAPAVAIVNRAFARMNFAGRNPIGRRLSLGGSPETASASSPWSMAIVGVVDNARDGNPGDDVRPTVYLAFAQPTPQLGWHTAAIAVRTAADPLVLAEAVRREVASIAPDAAFYDVATMDHRVAVKTAPQRQRAVLFGLFAAAAVLLAGLGLYGLLTYAVSQDMREFGVRLAIGASRPQLLGLVLRRGVLPACVGVVFGLAGALVLTRVLASLLYGVSPSDPITYVGAAIAMIAVSIVASVFPARRAMNTDPAVVLRGEG